MWRRHTQFGKLPAIDCIAGWGAGDPRFFHTDLKILKGLGSSLFFFRSLTFRDGLVRVDSVNALGGHPLINLMFPH